jgi:hypothetical protein
MGSCRGECEAELVNSRHQAFENAPYLIVISGLSGPIGYFWPIFFGLAFSGEDSTVIVTVGPLRCVARVQRGYAGRLMALLASSTGAIESGPGVLRNRAVK